MPTRNPYEKKTISFIHQGTFVLGVTLDGTGESLGGKQNPFVGRKNHSLSVLVTIGMGWCLYFSLFVLDYRQLSDIPRRCLALSTIQRERDTARRKAHEMKYGSHEADSP
jgi:hypothetical protein